MVLKLYTSKYSIANLISLVDLSMYKGINTFIMLSPIAFNNLCVNIKFV